MWSLFSLPWLPALCSYAAAAPLFEAPPPSFDLNLTAPGARGGTIYPPRGPPGHSGGHVLCWYPLRERYTITSPPDCNQALNLLIHEPEPFQPQSFHAPPKEGYAPAPDVWQHGSCSIQLWYFSKTVPQGQTDIFSYYQVASTARAIMSFCLEGIKAPQGGSGWVGTGKGYFVSVQGTRGGASLGTESSDPLTPLPPSPSASPSNTSISIPLSILQISSTHSPAFLRRAQPSPSTSPSPSPHPSPSILHPHCFPGTSGRPTSVETCRLTLNHIRHTYTPYRKTQLFEMYRSPPRPFVPPLTHLHLPGSSCVIQVFAPPGVTDRFSWEDVRRAAIEVLEYCADGGRAGVGGQMGLGRGLGWRVVVLGLRIEPPPEGGRVGMGVNGTGGMLVGGENGTEVIDESGALFRY